MTDTLGDAGAFKRQRRTALPAIAEATFVSLAADGGGEGWKRHEFAQPDAPMRSQCGRDGGTGGNRTGMRFHGPSRMREAFLGGYSAGSWQGVGGFTLHDFYSGTGLALSKKVARSKTLFARRDDFALKVRQRSH